MIILIYIVMLLAIIAVATKLSLLPWWKSLAYGVVYLLFSWYITPYTANSNRNEIEAYLSDPIARQYVAILVTIECAIVIAFAFRGQRQQSRERMTRGQLWQDYLLKGMTWIECHYVTLLIFPTLYFIESQAIYALTGVDFSLTALLVGGLALLWSVAGGLLVKGILPQKSAREELVVVISLLMSIVALLSTNTQVLLFQPQTNKTEMNTQLSTALLSILLLLIIGYVGQRVRRYKINRVTYTKSPNK